MVARVRWLVVAAWGLVAPCAAAQESAPIEHGVAIEAAALIQGLDDIMASPVRYTGGGLAGGLVYRGEARDWRWAVRGVAGEPKLTSRLTSDAGGYEESKWMSASADLLRRVWAGPDASAWIGPGMAVEIGIRRHVYTHDTWLNFANTFAALQVAVMGEVAVGGGQLSELLAGPLLGVAVRKEYAGVIRRERRVETAFPPFLLARHRLTYRRPLTPTLELLVSHDASLVRHEGPELAHVSHRLGVALEWRTK